MSCPWANDPTSSDLIPSFAPRLTISSVTTLTRVRFVPLNGEEGWEPGNF